MADLWMSTNLGRWRVLSIAPVVASPERDATEYEVAFQPRLDSETVVRRFSVAGYQMLHDDIWAVARVFWQLSAITGLTVPVSLFGESGHEHVCLYAGAGWFRVTLWVFERKMPPIPESQIRWGQPVGKSIERRPFVSAEAIVLEDAAEEIYRRVFFRVPLDEAQQFGAELLKEIVDACPEWATEWDRRSP